MLGSGKMPAPGPTPRSHWKLHLRLSDERQQILCAHHIRWEYGKAVRHLDPLHLLGLPFHKPEGFFLGDTSLPVTITRNSFTTPPLGCQPQAPVLTSACLPFAPWVMKLPVIKNWTPGTDIAHTKHHISSPI